MTHFDQTASRNLETFRRDGVLTLSNVVDTLAIAALNDSFWDEVEQKFSIRKHDRDSWHANPFNPMGDSRARRLSGMNPVMNDLRATGKLSIAEAALQRAIDAIFGANRWEPLDKWYSLLTFPGTESEWTIPTNSWHNDEPIVASDPEPWSIFAFLFLDRVQRETGPTLAVTGSHRRGQLLAEEHGVKSVREVRAFENVNQKIIADPDALTLLPVGQLLPGLAATDEWFSELATGDAAEHRVQRFMSSGSSQHGIVSRVVDLSGEAGDVALFDPRCLHSVSANISEHPRQVLRLDFRRLAPRVC